VCSARLVRFVFMVLAVESTDCYLGPTGCAHVPFPSVGRSHRRQRAPARACLPVGGPLARPSRFDVVRGQSSRRNAEMKASWGTSTRPMDFIFFFPSFCFSRSLRLRLMSPP
jgi:hypothetical protein